LHTTKAGGADTTANPRQDGSKTAQESPPGRRPFKQRIQLGMVIFHTSDNSENRVRCADVKTSEDMRRLTR